MKKHPLRNIGTALLLEEFGNVIARGGAGVGIASQSGHRLPALSAEQNALLAKTPVEQLLALPMLQPDQVKDSLHAYQIYGPETGCFLHPGYGGLTLHHLIREGRLPNGAHKVLSITGFLAARLTGSCSIDETMAASWGVLDVQSRCWHQPLLKLLDIPNELLPEIVASCRPLSPVVHSSATGLAPQTMLFSPAGDNQAGFAGVRDLGGQEAVVSLGTSAQISVFTPQYSFTPELETRPFPGGVWVLISEIFPNRHRAEGQALGSFTHWLFAALLTTFFPKTVAQFAPGYVFLFFCCMMVLQLIWVRTMVPETMGISLEDMQKRLHIGETWTRSL